MAANFFARLNTAKPYYYREFMFKADDYRLRLKDLSETLSEAKYALDIDNIGEKLKQLQAEQEKPEVWNDLEKSKHIGREISVIEGKIAAYKKGESALKDAQAFVDLIEEADDESLVPELEKMISTAEADIEEMRIKALLKGKYDSNNAILSLHAGAGGTEACDWTQDRKSTRLNSSHVRKSRMPSSA